MDNGKSLSDILDESIENLEKNLESLEKNTEAMENALKQLQEVCIFNKRIATELLEYLNENE